VGGNALSATYLVSLFGNWQRSTIYGRIPAQQAVASGSYSDGPAIVITY
jgi:spore coat protein U-like protein